MTQSSTGTNVNTKSTKTPPLATVAMFPPRGDAKSNAPCLSGYLCIDANRIDEFVDALRNATVKTRDDGSTHIELDIAVWKRFSQIDGSFNRVSGSVTPRRAPVAKPVTNDPLPGIGDDAPVDETVPM